MIRPIQYVTLLMLAVLAVSACAPGLKPRLSDSVRREIDRAERLMAKGDYGGAERAYRSVAAKVRSPGKEHFMLLAAEALLRAGDNTGVAAVTNRIDPRRLDPDDKPRYYLVTAQLALNTADPHQAMEQLNHLEGKRLSPEFSGWYHRQRAAAYAALGDPLGAARERAALGEMLKGRAERDENNAAILDLLSQASVDQLTARQPPPPDRFGGWLALMVILKENPPNTRGLQRDLDAWRADFPNHPAMAGGMRDYIERYHKALHTPRFIAVLLPQSGPYTGAAGAVRDGIVAAHRRRPDSERPALQFYDSYGVDPSTVYRRAIADGATFAIGPLNKENVRLLASRGELSVPVLALNQAPNQQQDNLIQFGLNPVDEIRQAASSAWFDGHHKALILVPASAFGGRMAHEFATYWQTLGGAVLATQSYDPDDVGDPLPIERLLRFESHPGLHGYPAGTTSTRNDADFIFLVASPAQARLLRPLLDRYQSSVLPLYSTSLIYGGRPDPEKDRALDGIVFCDIPFLFAGQSSEPLPGVDMRPSDPAWADLPGPYLRLVAMGVDAYQLAFNTRRLISKADGIYPGLTGALSLSEGGRIRRDLYCAQFRGGIPRIRAKGMQLEADLGRAGGLRAVVHGDVRR